MSEQQRRSDPPNLLDEELEAELCEALRAAWRPGDLDASVNELLIAQALEDPLAEASQDEQAESERLRAALEGAGDHPDADLAALLRHAVAPSSPSELSVERAVRAALPATPARRNVLALGAGVTATVLALAASVALVLRPPGDESATVADSDPLLTSRSTASLFHEKFDPEATSARVDRIALARAKDLRANRYTLWGVR